MTCRTNVNLNVNLNINENMDENVNINENVNVKHGTNVNLLAAEGKVWVDCEYLQKMVRQCISVYDDCIAAMDSKDPKQIVDAKYRIARFKTFSNTLNSDIEKLTL